MTTRTILILYSLPYFLLPDGSVDVSSPKSVLGRLQAVKKALASRGHRVKVMEMKEDVSPMVGRILRSKAELIFNLCEEFRGQSRLEMNVAALLELLNVPFSGSSSLVLGLSQDKAKTKSILAHYGVPTPAYVVWSPGESPSVTHLKFPLIVKPLKEDASLGIDNDALVKDSASLFRQAEKIHQSLHQSALVEEYIEGRELNVSILGNEDPQILPISEIDFSTLPPHLPRICGYDAKWVETTPEFNHTVPLCPASLLPRLEKRVREVALLSYRLMDCRDYARVDIRLSPDGTPYVLEINANPDISPDAGMPRSAAAAGLSYPQLIDRIAELAFFRSQRSRGPAQSKPHE
jgi:D-alanine-D-alanine ligase